MTATAARAYLAFGVLAVALNVALGGSNALYDAVGLTSATVILIGTALHRPRAWRAWVGIGVSEALFVVGDLVYSSGAASPAPADACCLTAGVLLVASIGSLVLSSGRARDVSANLDAGLLALIVGACGWSVFASDVMTHGSIASWLDATYRAGGWLDTGWLLSCVLLATAALQPAMVQVIASRADDRVSLPVRRAFVLGLGLIAVPSSMVIHHFTGSSAGGLADEVAMLLITVGVVLRGGLLVRDLERLRRQAEQSERRFRMVFERAPIGISIGSNGIMSETNPALQQMLGYSGSQFAHMHYTDITHPDDRAVMQQLELDAGSRDAFAIDKRYQRSDGAYIDAHVNVALDVEGGLGISLIEDVTGRRELEDQLRQAQKMDSIGKLAGGIAHDFNNLMTAVIGYSDLLLQQSGAAGSREKVEAIRDSAVRASDLTRQLLAFSRRQILQTQDIDLRDVVTRMDTLLVRLIGEDVRLQTLTGVEPVIVRADQTQLEQVVMNLAVNARDAMPDGGLLTVAVVSDGAAAVLSVIDDGIGMDEETQAKIFEPFFTTKPLAESSGLGLSTVHGIVGQSGGTVQVESRPGQGTAFTIRLPLVRTAVLPGLPAPATLVD